MIILPLPPSLNHAYITRRGSGQRIQTKECKIYKNLAAMLVKSKVKEPFNELSLIIYRFYLPDNRRRDLPDNFGKVLRDALKGSLYQDDCWQVIREECFMAMGIDKDNPRVEVVYIE